VPAGRAAATCVGDGTERGREGSEGSGASGVRSARRGCDPSGRRGPGGVTPAVAACVSEVDGSVQGGEGGEGLRRRGRCGGVKAAGPWHLAARHGGPCPADRGTAWA